MRSPAPIEKAHSSRKALDGQRGGFSLTELLVTIAIFVTISSVILFSFPLFSSKATLSNLAHEVALAIRQAQTFSINIKELGRGAGVFPSYGVFFSSTAPTEFLLFADTNTNGQFGASDEVLERFTIAHNNRLGRLCGYETPTAECTTIEELHITFTRPDPEAAVQDGDGTAYSYATIEVSSPRGDTRQVSAWSNGQIAVQ